MGMDDIGYCFDTPETLRTRDVEAELKKAKAKIRKLQRQIRAMKDEQEFGGMRSWRRGPGIFRSDE